MNINPDKYTTGYIALTPTQPEPMTMRDIFAAHALPECIYLVSPEDDSLEPAAQLAYKLADAMLEARKQPGSPVITQTQEKSL